MAGVVGMRATAAREEQGMELQARLTNRNKLLLGVVAAAFDGIAASATHGARVARWAARQEDEDRITIRNGWTA